MCEYPIGPLPRPPPSPPPKKSMRPVEAEDLPGAHLETWRPPGPLRSVAGECKWCGYADRKDPPHDQDDPQEMLWTAANNGTRPNITNIPPPTSYLLPESTEVWFQRYTEWVSAGNYKQAAAHVLEFLNAAVTDLQKAREPAWQNREREREDDAATFYRSDLFTVLQNRDTKNCLLPAWWIGQRLPVVPVVPVVPEPVEPPATTGMKKVAIGAAAALGVGAAVAGLVYQHNRADDVKEEMKMADIPPTTPTTPTPTPPTKFELSDSLIETLRNIAQTRCEPRGNNPSWYMQAQ